MKHIGKLAGLALSAVAALSMTVPAFAADYSFTTTAPRDYYGSTSYEDVYGAQYNYGGRNVVDYQAPELGYGCPSTTMTGAMERTILPGLQDVVRTVGTGGYGIGSSGPITELVVGTGGTGSTSVVNPGIPQVTVPAAPAFTSVSGMARSDGSIGTLSIQAGHQRKGVGGRDRRQHGQGTGALQLHIRLGRQLRRVRTQPWG